MIILKGIINKKKRGNKNRLEEIVNKIIGKVKNEDDKALIELTMIFDGVELDSLKVSKKEMKEAYNLVDEKTIESLYFAASQIKFYARKQLACLKPLEYENIPGVVLGHRLIPVSSCACYIPGGRYPLPSTALVTVLVAKVAGVKRIVACSPPSRKFHSIHPAILVALDIAGADEVYAIGGAQAIAACAYGTKTIQPVDLIVGPGNKFVNEAKKQVIGDVGIDNLAGPSEILIIADESASSDYIVIDLLAQCEHDPATRSALVTTSRKLANRVLKKIKKEANTLATSKVILKSWEENGQIILVDNLEEAIDFANNYAPEHLELQTAYNNEIASKLINFGSLFIGPYTPVAFGDYVSGTNHTLPTMRTSRYSSGLWIGSFIKISFYQKINKNGAMILSDAGSHMAKIEGLLAHQRSINIRTGKL
jgi:histidinol dehydrogenase/sulfopropanediol 3-dehydrogenase